MKATSLSTGACAVSFADDSAFGCVSASTAARKRAISPLRPLTSVSITRGEGAATTSPWRVTFTVSRSSANSERTRTNSSMVASGTGAEAPPFCTSIAARNCAMSAFIFAICTVWAPEGADAAAAFATP